MSRAGHVNTIREMRSGTADAGPVTLESVTDEAAQSARSALASRLYAFGVAESPARPHSPQLSTSAAAPRRPQTALRTNSQGALSKSLLLQGDAPSGDGIVRAQSAMLLRQPCSSKTSLKLGEAFRGNTAGAGGSTSHPLLPSHQTNPHTGPLRGMHGEASHGRQPPSPATTPKRVPRVLRRATGAWVADKEDSACIDEPSHTAHAEGSGSDSVLSRADGTSSGRLTRGSTRGGAVEDPTEAFLAQVHTALQIQPFVYVVMTSLMSEVWDPYGLRIVPYTWLTVPRYKANHFTFSIAGVTHLVLRDGKQEADFCSLDEWKREAALFRKVQQLPFFRNYYRWRAHLIWKRQLASHKRVFSGETLTSKAFLLHPIFGPALVRVRSLCESLSGIPLHALLPSAEGSRLDDVSTKSEERQIAHPPIRRDHTCK